MEGAGGGGRETLSGLTELGSLLTQQPPSKQQDNVNGPAIRGERRIVPRQPDPECVTSTALLLRDWRVSFATFEWTGAPPLSNLD